VTNRVRPLVVTLSLLALLTACVSPAPGARSEVTPEQLVGTWTIDTVVDSPEQPFIDIAEDGEWTASDGCNRVVGTWELGDAGELTTTAGPSTLMACEGAQLPLAMTMADYVVVSGETLSIHSSAESTVTDLVRSDDPDVGSLGLPVGQWVESDATGAPMLSLAVDGSFSGNDGCNILSGSWLAKGDGSIAFEQVASTRRFCEGIDTWLALAAHARVLGTIMTIEDADGAVLGQLTRA